MLRVKLNFSSNFETRVGLISKTYRSISFHRAPQVWIHWSHLSLHYCLLFAMIDLHRDIDDHFVSSCISRFGNFGSLFAGIFRQIIANTVSIRPFHLQLFAESMKFHSIHTFYYHFDQLCTKIIKHPHIISIESYHFPDSRNSIIITTIITIISLFNHSITIP